MLGGIIDAVNTLQFIDSMTGRLAWPLAAIVLGIIFRRSVGRLLGRVRRLKWREGEAELADLAEATEDVQQAVEEVGKPLPEDETERAAAYRSRIERLVQDAVAWGTKLGEQGWNNAQPSLKIEWDGDQPRLRLIASDYERLLVDDLHRLQHIYRVSDDRKFASAAKRDAATVRRMLTNLRAATDALGPPTGTDTIDGDRHSG